MPILPPALGRPWRMAPLLLLPLTACGTGGPAYGPAGPDPIVEMTSDLAFRPKVVEVSVGQTVEWRNTSLFSHTLTTDPARLAEPGEVGSPAAAAVFHKEVAPGEIYRHRFTAPGAYAYVCVPHEGLGMRGTVIVRPAD